MSTPSLPKNRPIFAANYQTFVALLASLGISAADTVFLTRVLGPIVEMPPLIALTATISTLSIAAVGGVTFSPKIQKIAIGAWLALVASTTFLVFAAVSRTYIELDLVLTVLRCAIHFLFAFIASTLAALSLRRITIINDKKSRGIWLPRNTKISISLGSELTKQNQQQVQT